jgi:RHS repeat-associated protein
VKRHDYLPLLKNSCECWWKNDSARVCGDSTRQQFTSKERDDETGLDFSEARYYSSDQGRFTGIDPILTSIRKNHPQTWNRYTYVLNNPLVLVDPDGLQDQATATDLMRRMREQQQNQPITTTETTPVAEIQMRPMIATPQDTALIQQATADMGPLTRTQLNTANQALQDALGMVAAPQPGAPMNQYRDALLNNFGTAIPLRRYSLSNN